MIGLIKSKINNQNLYLMFIYLGVSTFYLINIENGFFWDAVQLGSRHAHYYLESNFSSLILPTSIDSGHIPSFGFSLALIWKYIDKNTITSHIFMFPFVIGLVYQVKKNLEYYVPKSYVLIALVLVLLNSTLLSQITMVTPDVPLIFIFFIALNSIIYDNKKNLLMAIVFLFLISMRGMMISFCLMLFDFYTNISFKNITKQTLHDVFKRSLIYVPGFIIFVMFSIYHFEKTGWIGFHKNSPWAPAFESVNFFGYLRNILVLGYRQIEFGKLGFWIVALVILIRNKKSIVYNGKLKGLLFLNILFLIIFPLNMLWAKGLLHPRYLLPTFLVFSLLVTFLLFNYEVKRKFKLISLTIIILSFLLGGLNIFPKINNQAWDATVAHIPYFKLRLETIKQIKSKNINLNDVGTFFPNIASLEMIDLNDNKDSFTEFDGKNKYVLISNVYNVDKQILNEISNSYKLEFENERLGIKMKFLKRRE